MTDTTEPVTMEQRKDRLMEIIADDLSILRSKDMSESSYLTLTDIHDAEGIRMSGMTYGVFMMNALMAIFDELDHEEQMMVLERMLMLKAEKVMGIDKPTLQ